MPFCFSIRIACLPGDVTQLLYWLNWTRMSCWLPTLLTSSCLMCWLIDNMQDKVDENDRMMNIPLRIEHDGPTFAHWVWWTYLCTLSMMNLPLHIEHDGPTFVHWAWWTYLCALSMMDLPLRIEHDEPTFAHWAWWTYLCAMRLEYRHRSSKQWLPEPRCLRCVKSSCGSRLWRQLSYCLKTKYVNEVCPL